MKNEDGRYNASGSPIYYNPCENNSNNNNQNDFSNSVIISKSDDNTLKSLKINNESIDINDSMIYKTKESFATIEAIASNIRATVEYDKYIDLSIGENNITLIVIAENGNKKEYKLNIIREKELSNNKNIIIKVDNEKLDFILFKNEDISISSDKNKLNITYELEDKNAKAEIIGNENLKVGKNEIVVRVIAENGEEQEYKIIVNKSSKVEEIIYGIIILYFIVVVIIGIVFLLKRKNLLNRIKLFN